MNSKNVLITGCSSGIGEALAKEFAAKGYSVFATARNIESIKPLQAHGISCLTLDVTSSDDIVALMELLKKDAIDIDILVNNAGYALFGPSIELTDDELKAQFDTNVFAPLALIRQLAPTMIRRKTGIIVNIGSVSGILVTPFAGPYCATKAALHAFSDALRMELAPFNVKVVCVQPGAIKSAFGDNAGSKVDEILKENSFYKKIGSAIKDRAHASQKRPSTAESFAKNLVAGLSHDKPKPIMRIGNGSSIIPWLPTLLPGPSLDKLLSKSFQLFKLTND